MKIGVFDSGIGGLSVARAIEHTLPQHEVIFMDDQQHMPYGTRAPQEVLALVRPVLQALIDRGCEVIVVACNTVTTTLINDIRAEFSQVPFVAIEPMVKPAAAQSVRKVIAVCATPATLASERYAYLKRTYAADITVLEPDCADWAFMIEHKTVDEHKIGNRINEVLDKRADVIVLGCTHYHWIEQTIKNLAKGRATVIQPEAAIIKQLQRVLADRSAA